MAARAIGALFAVVAALLFVAALASALAPSVVPGWRDGHPRVAGHTYDRKEVHVGLVSASGCNLGPPVECESVSTGSLLEPVGFAELAALALVTLTTIGLLVSIWRIGERRRGLGRLVIIEALIAAAITGTWVAIGIEIKGIDAEVDVPLGLGLFAFAGGAGAALVAGVLARFVEREPLRLKSPRVAPAAQPPSRDPFEAFDVRELVPTGTGPQAPVQPQLRALYDVVTPPVPPAPLPLPVAAPAFVDAGDRGDVAGAHIPTPAPPTPQHALPIPRPTPPPPSRPTPPPQPPLSRDVRRELGEAPTIPASAGIRAASMLEPPTVPAPSAKSQRAKAASLPPPAALRTRPGASGSHPAHPGAGAAPERVARQPTTPHVAPPMPAVPTAAARAATEADPATTVEIDAEAKAKWKAQQAKSAAAAAQAAQAEADAQELAIASAPTRAAEPLDLAELVDGAGPRPPADTAENALALLAAEYSTGDSTDVQRVVEPTPGPTSTIIGPAPIPEPLASLASAQSAAPPGAPTAQMAAVMPAAVMPAAVMPAAAIAPPPARSPALKAPQISVPKIIPAMAPAAAPKPDGERDRDRDRERDREPKDVKVPLSTAPASLPPPKPAQATTSGPTPACPQCEAPMAWVEEHLRFYCAQCRMYF